MKKKFISDDKTTIADLKQIYREFVFERHWDRYHNAKDMVEAVLSEAGELIDLFRFKSYQECDQMFNEKDSREAVTDEMVDVFMIIARIADKYDIDLASEIQRKMAKNIKKYPADNWQKEEHKYIDKVAWIYVKDRKVLAARFKGESVFYIPGGKREGMERDRETLIREVKEELSVDIKKQTIKKLGQFEAQAHGEPLGVKVIMHCYLAEYDGDLKEGSEVEEISWLSYEDVNSEKTSPVDKLVLSYLRDEGMID